MKKVKDYFNRYKKSLYYILFGIITTLINGGIYYVCYDLLNIPNVVSTVAAWLMAVGFAFITNKLWVFESKVFRLDVCMQELYKFIAARLITGVLDVCIMYVSVDLCSMNANVFKLISNGLVIVLNYALGKFIFTKK